MDIGYLRFEAVEEAARQRAQGTPRRLNNHEFGAQRWLDDWINDEIALADVVDADEARQYRDPIRARDEFERADHGIHFQPGGDLHPMRLEIGFEVAAADVLRPGHDDFQRRAIGELHRCKRREPPLAA